MGFWFLASAMGQYLAGVVGTMMAIPSEGGATTISAVESLGIDVYKRQVYTKPNR